MQNPNNLRIEGRAKDNLGNNEDISQNPTREWGPQRTAVAIRNAASYQPVIRANGHLPVLQLLPASSSINTLLFPYHHSIRFQSSLSPLSNKTLTLRERTRSRSRIYGGHRIQVSRCGSRRRCGDLLLRRRRHGRRCACSQPGFCCFGRRRSDIRRFYLLRCCDLRRSSSSVMDLAGFG